MNTILVDADWRPNHLSDSSIHVIGTRVGIVPLPPGPADYVSQYSDFIENHIPGAAYFQMGDDLSGATWHFRLRCHLKILCAKTCQTSE
jgi:3-mercaptopyruvate sulfurtransferase SseA